MVSTPRSAYLDNAKAILIIIVVFTHLFSPVLAGNEPERWLYYTVLFFHMPAFAFVSGWLSKPELFSKKGMVSLGWLVWAYVVLSMVNHAVWVILFDARFRPLVYLRDPYFALWFLQALVWWRVLLFVFGRGKGRSATVISIAVALGVALLAGYLPEPGSLYSASRTLAFLPFFVAGYRFKQLGLDVRRTWWSRGLAVAAFVGVYVGLMVTRILPNRIPLLYDRTFAELGDLVWATVPGRITLMAVSVVLVAAFLHLVPRRKLPITPLGITLISVYGWHALLVRLMRQYELSEALVGSWPKVLVFTAVIVFVFGFGPIARATLWALTGRRLRGRAADG